MNVVGPTKINGLVGMVHTGGTFGSTSGVRYSYGMLLFGRAPNLGAGPGSD